ncbi:hypothetical protein MJO28_014319 [Puccinia striiformis f. sp. tritici]|uniref:Uncharacterized protein n=1 Tax=Puccinia striiformis f. sp. tritici TaxID=168172 RepID=A0ACC0DTK7_9BASI|nr:hypothetical protein MJO28_014319 [Puccinia striiformis f. sp. tritici]
MCLYLNVHLAPQQPLPPEFQAAIEAQTVEMQRLFGELSGHMDNLKGKATKKSLLSVLLWQLQLQKLLKPTIMHVIGSAPVPED